MWGDSKGFFYGYHPEILRMFRKAVLAMSFEFFLGNEKFASFTVTVYFYF